MSAGGTDHIKKTSPEVLLALRFCSLIRYHFSKHLLSGRQNITWKNPISRDTHVRQLRAPEKLLIGLKRDTYKY